MFAAPTSATVPAATWLAETSALDALNAAGVVPNEHWRVAPVQTRLDIASAQDLGAHQRWTVVVCSWGAPAGDTVAAPTSEIDGAAG